MDMGHRSGQDIPRIMGISSRVFDMRSSVACVIWEGLGIRSMALGGVGDGGDGYDFGGYRDDLDDHKASA